MPELIRSVRENIIAFSTESTHYQETFFDLLEGEWPTSILQQQKIVESDETWQSIKIYLDDGKYDEWDALRIDNNNKRYIHLGNGFCIPLE